MKPYWISFALMMNLAPTWCLAQPSQEEFFESRVRPLLVQHCYECHRRLAKNGLRLDSRELILQGGNSGPAIVPGNARGSLLWQVVAGKHAEIAMPPDDPLASEQISILQEWIDNGAYWPATEASSASKADRSSITNEEREFWSFQPLREFPFEQCDGRNAVHPIDLWIASRYRELALEPVDQLGARQLIRRMTFDLTGLPATPTEIEQFIRTYSDDAERAREQLVERLLASPAYGQRWAQHWLDLARYADTAGDAADFPIPEAYKYRNYVIDAFNEDKPYNEFVREQIAGDLLPSEDEQTTWNRKIATGYLAISRRIGVTPETLPHIRIEDTLDNLGKTFLGLSIGCARCHDHKFDPIPTADYYALYGIFASSIYPHAGAEHKPYRSDFVYRVGARSADEILSSYRTKLEPLLKDERAAFERYRDFQRKPISRPGYNRDVAWAEVLAIREKIRQVAETFPDLETAYAISEGKPQDVRIHKQGDPGAPGPVVPRGFLQILGDHVLPKDHPASGRLQLANWIASPSNPLTARVIVNRVWHSHFGRGLVSSTSDFGLRGEPPSHPELLDYLARFLIEKKWSLKELHRLILSSQTYRLASSHQPRNAEIDPENIFLWRGNRRRLDAEQLRDSILAVSGRLDRTIGMRHPFPHALTYFFRQHEPFVANYETNQRTIYQFRQRIRKDAYLDTFDGPDGNLPLGQRRETTTSIQSLFFMNSAFVDENAKAIADLMMEWTSSNEERAVWLYQNLFGRPPTLDEIKFIGEAIERTEINVTPEDSREVSVHVDATAPFNTKGWSSLIRAMLGSNEFLFID